jgi:hypothetical protein
VFWTERAVARSLLDQGDGSLSAIHTQGENHGSAVTFHPPQRVKLRARYGSVAMDARKRRIQRSSQLGIQHTLERECGALDAQTAEWSITGLPLPQALIQLRQRLT